MSSNWRTYFGMNGNSGLFHGLWGQIGLVTSQKAHARWRRSGSLARLLPVELLEERLVLTPAVSLEVAPTNVQEDVGNTLFFTFTRTETAGALAINFSVGGTATFNSDYTQTGATTFTLVNGTATFADGSDTANVTVNVTTDDTTEPDETVILTVTNGAGYTVGASPIATGTILNDDSLVSIAADAASTAEGNANSTAFTFTVTRTGDLSDSDTVDYVVTGSGVNPANAADFGGVFPSGTVTFGQGVVSQTITINVSGDTTAEADERFTVTLQNPSSHLHLGTPSAFTFITNDDPIIALSALTIAENLPVGAAVGTLSVPIPGVVGIPVFTLVPGVGDTNNASFNIVGDQLVTTESFNFEAKANYSIRVHMQDGGTLSSDRVFTISVQDANDGLQLTLGVNPVSYTKKPIRLFQSLSLVDPDVLPAFRVGGGQLELTLNNTVLNKKGTKSVDLLKTLKVSTIGISDGFQLTGTTLKLQVDLHSATTATQLQTFLREMTFKTKKAGLSNAQRTVEVKVTDAAALIASVIQTVNLTT